MKNLTKLIVFLLSILFCLFSMQPPAFAQRLKKHADVVTKTNFEPAYTTQEPIFEKDLKKVNPAETAESQAVRTGVEEVEKEIKTLESGQSITENNPMRKAARGAVNATLGWVEIPRQIVNTSKEKKGIGSILLSPFKGISLFVSRTAVGIFEISTFLIPPYKPVINPEFIFSENENK